MDTYVTQGEGTEERDERLCTHLREDGSLCKGWKVKGELLCAGHLKLGIAADPSAYARSGAAASAEVRQERAEVARERRNTSLEDRLAARLEAQADVIVDRMMRIIEAGGDAEALRAINSLLDRVYGTAVQRTRDETQVMPTEVAEIELMSPEERIAFIRAHRLRAVGD